MAATLKQIALKTGLSIPTVNQILTGYRTTFTDETKRKVREAAAELNYRPNMTARSLVTQRSFLIGVLFYSVNYDIVTPFMLGLQESIRANGCSPIFFTHGSVAEELQNLENVLDRRVDGLIVNAAVEDDGTTNAERFKAVHAAGTPMVEVLGRFIPKVPKITLDHRLGGRTATESLVAAGHRRIVLLTNERFKPSSAKVVVGPGWTLTECWQGYVAAMKDAGLTPEVVKYPADSTAKTAARTLQRRVIVPLPKLFADPDTAPTAVVCYSDLIADPLIRYIERMPALATRGLAVATASGGSNLESDSVRVMRHPFPVESAGRAAGEVLFNAIAGRPADSVAIEPRGAAESDS